MYLPDYSIHLVEVNIDKHQPLPRGGAMADVVELLLERCSISCGGCRWCDACCRCGAWCGCCDGCWYRSFSIGGSGEDARVVACSCRAVSRWCRSRHIGTPSRSNRYRAQGHIPWHCGGRVCPSGSFSFLDSCAVL